MLTLVPEDVTSSLRTVSTDGGPLPVAVVTPATVDRTFVVAMGYGARLDEFELQRFRLLAPLLRGRLVVVQTPGHGADASRLTPRERWALLARSDFRPVARRMLQAATTAEPSVCSARTAVLGYSLGASLGTAIASVLREGTGTPVPLLVLVEPVAGRPWRPLDLAGATRAEDGLVDDALAQNDDVAGAVGPPDRRPEPSTPDHHRVDLLLLANALRAGRLGAQVVASGATHVVVVRGKDSRLSLPAAVADVVDAARSAGRRVDELTMHGTHALWHSLPSVRRLGRFVADVAEDHG